MLSRFPQYLVLRNIFSIFYFLNFELIVLLTANPSLLLNHPKDKTVIKYETLYNKDINVKHYITNFKELKTKIKEIYD